MTFLILIICSLVVATSYAYKSSDGIQVNVTKNRVVLDITEHVSILCATSERILEDGYKVINKIEIDKSSQNEISHETEHQIVASIDNYNGTRGAIFPDGTLKVKGSIKEVTNSFLVMTFTVATVFALGDYSCNIHGYSNDVSAHPLIRSSYNSETISRTETDIDTVTQLVVEEKKAIEALDQRVKELQSDSLILGIKLWPLLSSDGFYAEYWPTGNFSLLKPATGCPPNTRAGGWRQPSIKIFTKNWGGNEDRVPDEFPAQPPQDKEASIVLQFCSLGGKGHFDWPPGDYCIHKNVPNDHCPAGFAEGAIALGMNSLQVSKEVLKRNPPARISTLDDKHSLVNVSFCCRNDGNITQAISLPTHAPFYMYQYKSNGCQAVNDMDVKVDYLHIDTSSQNVDEAAGETPRHRLNGVRLWLCQYTLKASPMEEIWQFLSSPITGSAEDEERDDI